MSNNEGNLKLFAVSQLKYQWPAKQASYKEKWGREEEKHHWKLPLCQGREY
jgi:hypothetical protein